MQRSYNFDFWSLGVGMREVVLHHLNLEAQSCFQHDSLPEVPMAKVRSCFLLSGPAYTISSSMCHTITY
jgi:hypothetical protein